MLRGVVAAHANPLHVLSGAKVVPARAFIYSPEGRLFIVGLFRRTPGETFATYMSLPRHRVFPSPPEFGITRIVAASPTQHPTATDLHGSG